MARATAICTCKKCGAEFEKVATKHNRREADSWEEWAIATFDTCPDCYKAQKRQESQSLGLIVEIRLDNTAALIQGVAEAVAVVINGGYDYKERLKSIKYRYTDDYPAGRRGGPSGLLVDMIGGSGRNVWAKRIALDDIQAEAEAIIAMGGKCTVPTKTDLELYAGVLARGKANKAAKDAKLQDALAELGPIPQWPEDIAPVIAGKRWNGKFYGKSGAWRVYMSGEEIKLTDSQKAAMEKAAEARGAWRAKKDAITKDV